MPVKIGIGHIRPRQGEVQAGGDAKRRLIHAADHDVEPRGARVGIGRLQLVAPVGDEIGEARAMDARRGLVVVELDRPADAVRIIAPLARLLPDVPVARLQLWFGLLSLLAALRLVEKCETASR